MGFNCLKATATSRRQPTFYHQVLKYLEVTFYLQIFLVLILSIPEGWKAGSTLEPTSGSEHGTTGLEIQRFNH